MTSNRHAEEAFDLSAVFGYDQLVHVGSVGAHGGTLVLLMTDVLDLVRVPL